jgi:hypothetical protein
MGVVLLLLIANEGMSKPLDVVLGRQEYGARTTTVKTYFKEFLPLNRFIFQ